MKKIVAILAIICGTILPGCSSDKDAGAVKPAEGQKEFVIAGEKVELKKIDLIADKLEIAIPATFDKMSAEMQREKYPNSKPSQLVYTDSRGSINIALSQTANDVKDKQIAEAKDNLKNAVKASAKEWYQDGVAKVNGKNIAYLEFLSDAADSRVYNHMMLLEADHKLLIISFNCMEKDKQDWQPMAKVIMNSIKVK